jgi:hypothetical protein
MEGSSFVQDGPCFSRYTVVTLDTVIEAWPLPVETNNLEKKVLNMGTKF